MGIPTFWGEPTGRSWCWLRRYVDRHYDPDEPAKPWTCEGGWHEAKVRTDDSEREEVNGDVWSHDDPRWPVECDQGCGYRFVDADPWQLSAHHEYRSTGPDGRSFTLFEAPAGAMWDAHWMGDRWRGPDGIVLVVSCPQNAGGRTLGWTVDGRASNCTLPDDDVHKCWVRHGDPRTEPVTVDKDGVTCAAGAGSIMIGDWHGFLRNGELVE